MCKMFLLNASLMALKVIMHQNVSMSQTIDKNEQVSVYVWMFVLVSHELSSGGVSDQMEVSGGGVTHGSFINAFDMTVTSPA